CSASKMATLICRRFAFRRSLAADKPPRPPRTKYLKSACRDSVFAHNYDTLSYFFMNTTLPITHIGLGPLGVRTLQLMAERAAFRLEAAVDVRAELIGQDVST